VMSFAYTRPDSKIADTISPMLLNGEISLMSLALTS